MQAFFYFIFLKRMTANFSRRFPAFFITIRLNKSGYHVTCFSYFTTKTYVVDKHLKLLTKALLISTTTYVSWRSKKNIYAFGLKKKKSYQELCMSLLLNMNLIQIPIIQDNVSILNDEN